MKRITHEPAYVLHSYDWSESSLILEVLTRHYGRVALVAKGVKRPSSNFRSVLLPLQPLQLGYTGGAEIGVLKSAEWQGGHVMPTGETLLAGYYLNEILMRMLPRDDAHPALFDAYAGIVGWLATSGKGGSTLSAGLSAFEIVLLREAGFLPALDMQTLNYQPLQAEAFYVLQPESGLLAVDEQQHVAAHGGLPGRYWLALHAALNVAPEVPSPLHALLALCLQQRDLTAALRPQLRHMLEYHCGQTRLRTRQLMMELRKL